MGENVKRIKELMGLKEIVIHIPEVIKNKDVTDMYHPKDKYGAGNIRYVKIIDLWAYKEYDRRKGSDKSNININNLKESIKENGFTSGNELIMNYYFNGFSSKALLIEGNHRLVACKELGMEFLPVRVNVIRTDNLKGYDCLSPFEIDTYLCKQYGYFPSSVDASMIFDEDALISGYLKGIDNI